MRLIVKTLCCLLVVNIAFAQTSERWQQRVEYKMDIDVDAEKHQFKGKQTLKYFNNSPDDLDKVFYHLYFNAFQPGSMMDMRNLTLEDADPRVQSRISKLKPEEIGYHKVNALTQNGKAVKYEVVGTILEVQLNEPISSGSTATFEMEFESQVPLQIRRSGRDNKEGIEFSMSQWYPKLSEYDYQGWHANPYIGREFHGVWGDFDVTIHMDKSYMIAATGYLQNAHEVGYGYEKEGEKVRRPDGDKLKWQFKAKDIHDFVWAADPDYKHTTAQVPDGPVLHFFYQEGGKTTAWEQLPEYSVKAFEYISKHYGKYPYDKYSIIQGGDGGMEYPMATLITGNRPVKSLVGVTVHEAMHTWYQMLLGTNESLYPWMDEGFTSYASNVVMKELGFNKEEFIHKGSYQGYYYLAKSGKEEPMTTHSDHYGTNLAYGLAAYSKGAVFVNQLEYIIGKKNLDAGMLKYFDAWAFKHPNPNDFIRIMEKQSGLELDWYKEYWVHTTHTIDYGIKSVEKEGKKETKISLERVGKMPMPVDVIVEYKNGDKEVFNIPLRIMRGEKSQEDKEMKYTVAEDWPWTHTSYDLVIPTKTKKVVAVTIDPSKRMADVNRDNNEWTQNK